MTIGQNSPVIESLLRSGILDARRFIHSMSNSTPPLVIPPELIGAITCGMDGMESNKACCVVTVVSSLGSESQRILFNTLTVSVKVENCAAIFKLLTDSPHIADYITNLIIMTLQHTMTSPDIENFRQILAKLRNVRRCTLDALWSRFPMHVPAGQSPTPPLAIPPLVLDFLVRQPLCELSLICIRIPTSILWHFLTTVPKLYLLESVVTEEASPAIVQTPVVRNPFLRTGRNPFLQAPILQTPVLHSLTLTKDLGQYIVLPQDMSRFATLRYLSFHPPGDGWAGKLIEAASRTLEHIHFDCSEHPPLNLPHLPALRTLELTFSVQRLFTPSGTITTAGPEILPALADVKIEHHIAKGGVFDPVPYAPLIALLETASAAYHTAPCIHWLLVTSDKETPVTHFTDTVRRGMPKAHSTGRLVLEAAVSSKAPIKPFRI
ncbi:hypothetical protein B0H12DRAFT_289829 [Mycena haematopus]|nr:hypothetical protein B0H12DRAFT_289829 [Mycena haematopus]